MSQSDVLGTFLGLFDTKFSTAIPSEFLEKALFRHKSITFTRNKHLMERNKKVLYHKKSFDIKASFFGFTEN